MPLDTGKANRWYLLNCKLLLKVDSSSTAVGAFLEQINNSYCEPIFFPKTWNGAKTITNTFERKVIYILYWPNPLTLAFNKKLKKTSSRQVNSGIELKALPIPNLFCDVSQQILFALNISKKLRKQVFNTAYHINISNNV